MPDRDLDQRVRDYLLAGDFGSRRRLPSERDLAQDLGISRPALRETLKTLTDQGLIEVRRGDGAYLSSVEFADLLAVRARLEPLAAELAAARRTAGDITVLQDAIAQMERSLDDPAAFAAADERIHRTLIEASGNRVLRRTLEQLAEMARFARQTTASAPGTRHESLDDVRALVKHTIAGRPAEAGAAVQQHLQHVAAAHANRTAAKAA